jgi:hypothetical protein
LSSSASAAYSTWDAFGALFRWYRAIWAMISISLSVKPSRR